MTILYSFVILDAVLSDANTRPYIIHDVQKRTPFSRIKQFKDKICFVGTTKDMVKIGIFQWKLNASLLIWPFWHRQSIFVVSLEQVLEGY